MDKQVCEFRIVKVEESIVLTEELPIHDPERSEKILEIIKDGKGKKSKEIKYIVFSHDIDEGHKRMDVYNKDGKYVPLEQYYY